MLASLFLTDMVMVPVGSSAISASLTLHARMLHASYSTRIQALLRGTALCTQPCPVAQDLDGGLVALDLGIEF